MLLLQPASIPEKKLTGVAFDRGEALPTTSRQSCGIGTLVGELYKSVCCCVRRPCKYPPLLELRSVACAMHASPASALVPSRCEVGRSSGEQLPGRPQTRLE